MHRALSHLDRLEAESIHIMREVVAECENPVMLYSIGKDSCVMQHLAIKAFFPARPPFPMLHIASGWDFREVLAFRDRRCRELALKLIVHANDSVDAAQVSPFTDPVRYADLRLTQALKQGLDRHGFDAAFGGGRRDEEKSRAKERIFSVRGAGHRWDPRRQRPELWNLYNTRRSRGETLRVFPLSNWTELDVWLYIQREHIPIVPLYFAAPRPIVRRGSQMIMVDDERCALAPHEQPEVRTVRFRTLGCYPLTGAVDSDATTLTDILRETLAATRSERQGRAVDQDGAASLERKKEEGYF